MFDKEKFDDLCWMMTMKKNYKQQVPQRALLSERDSFKLFCLFNLLSEDRYPLVMIPEEVKEDGGRCYVRIAHSCLQHAELSYAKQCYAFFLSCRTESRVNATPTHGFNLVVQSGITLECYDFIYLFIYSHSLDSFNCFMKVLHLSFHMLPLTFHKDRPR